jgi:hypothetical protein
MKRLIYHMIRRIPGILLVVLTVASAMAQKPIQHFVVDQCETYEFSVVDVPGDRYTWDLYRDSTVNFAYEKGDVDPVSYFENSMYEGSTVRVNWLEPGRYFLRVMAWDEVNCTNNLLLFLIDVVEVKPEALIEGDPTCEGEPVVLRFILTGRGPWNVTYTYGDGSNVINLNGITEPEYAVPIDPLPPGVTQFWVMEVNDQCTVNSYPVPNKTDVEIYPKPTNSRIYVKDK